MTPDHTLVDAMGWAATAVFVGSYFFTRAEILVRVQIAGALLWLTYGVLMRAPPVIAANLLVAGAGAWKAIQIARVRSAACPGTSRPPEIARGLSATQIGPPAHWGGNSKASQPMRRQASTKEPAP